MKDVFDRTALRLHRARAAPGLAAHDAIPREVAARLVERLDDLRRTFPDAAELGQGWLAPLLRGKFGIARFTACDLAEDEALPLQEGSFDLIASCLTLHWINDLPGALLQIRRALKPDGLFLAAMYGGETLKELRSALLDAEVAEEGGASPRVSPFADARDAGALLQRAGFGLPVVDVDTIRASYPDPFALMRELRGMGEANAVAARRRTFTRRATMARAAALYAERHGDRDGRVTATFEVLYLTGWRPHESQQVAAKRGSATTRLADALGPGEER